MRGLGRIDEWKLLANQSPFTVFKTFYDAMKKTESAFVEEFLIGWERIPQTVKERPKSMKPSRCVQASKGVPPRDGLDRGISREGGRTRWAGEEGDELTLVTVYAEEGMEYETNSNQ